MLLLMLEQGHSDVEKYWDNFSGKNLFHMASAKFENMQVNEGSDFFPKRGRAVHRGRSGCPIDTLSVYIKYNGIHQPLWYVLVKTILETFLKLLQPFFAILGHQWF